LESFILNYKISGVRALFLVLKLFDNRLIQVKAKPCECKIHYWFKYRQKITKKCVALNNRMIVTENDMEGRNCDLVI